MLLNFTVENCLSFKSEQEFTMLRKDRHGTQEEQGGGMESDFPRCRHLWR